MYEHAGGRTDSVGKPLFLDVFGVPDVFGEVGRPLVDIDELDELGIEVGVPEGAVRHEGVVEVFGIRRVAFEGVKLGKFCLRGSQIMTYGTRALYAPRCQDRIVH